MRDLCVSKCFGFFAHILNCENSRTHWVQISPNHSELEYRTTTGMGYSVSAFGSGGWWGECTGISRLGVNKQTILIFLNFYFFIIASAFCTKIVVLRQAGVYPRCSQLSLQWSYYPKPNFNQFFPITQHRGYPLARLADSDNHCHSPKCASSANERLTFVVR